MLASLKDAIDDLDRIVGHMIAVPQIRNLGSEGRTYYDAWATRRHEVRQSSRINRERSGTHEGTTTSTRYGSSISTHDRRREERTRTPRPAAVNRHHWCQMVCVRGLVVT
jgi:hypothetical protein